VVGRGGRSNTGGPDLGKVQGPRAVTWFAEPGPGGTEAPGGAERRSEWGVGIEVPSNAGGTALRQAQGPRRETALRQAQGPKRAQGPGDVIRRRRRALWRGRAPRRSHGRTWPPAAPPASRAWRARAFP